MAHRTTNWLTGATAGIGGVTAAEAMAVLTRGPSLVDAAGRLVVDLGPRPFIDLAVRLLRSSDKPVIRGAVVASVVAAGGALAPSVNRAGTRAAVLAVAGGLAAWTALRRPPHHPASAVSAAATGAVVAATILRAAPATRRTAAVATAAATGLWAARRSFHRRTNKFDAASAERATVVGSRAAPSDGAGSWPGAVPLITPTDDFYTVDVNVGTPLIDPRKWKLRMFGAVRRPLDWDLDTLNALGVEEFDAVMVCIHYQLGWHRVGNARWTGVPLRRLLDAVGVSEGAHTLVTRAVDDFTISLPLEVVHGMDGYVVTGMNGGPLPAGHGFPARVFIPGIYGQYTGVKWLTELEITEGPYPDYWARRGWPREPVLVRPMSRIDAPEDGRRVVGAVTLTGVAWAPPQGILRVEVAVDDGEWRSARLADELSPAAWRRWHYSADLPTGEHRIRTRAVANDGTTQDAAPRPPFPSGVSGYHAVTVHVVAATAA